MAIADSVLMSVRTSAPSSIAARAISTMSPTLGESLTIIGVRCSVARTAWSSSRRAAGSSPNWRPRSVFGQETFSSTRGRASAASNASATAT